MRSHNWVLDPGSYTPSPQSCQRNELSGATALQWSRRALAPPRKLASNSVPSKRAPRATLARMRLSTLIAAPLALTLAAGCHWVFRSAGDSDADAPMLDAASCNAGTSLETSLHQDTYIEKAQDRNHDDAEAMQVNGPTTAGLLEFRATIDPATARRKPRFQSFKLTIPIAPLTACAAACNANCTHTDGQVSLDLLRDSNWDENDATWTKRTNGTSWESPGALGQPDNLGPIAVSSSSSSTSSITFSVNPSQSDLLWSALSADAEWSFRISADPNVTFAFADRSKKVCNNNVPPPTLTITYCP